MKKSREIYHKKLIKKLSAKTGYDLKDWSIESLHAMELIDNKRKHLRKKKYSIEPKEHRSKEFYLEKLEKYGRIAVDCQYYPPSKLFNKEIKKGILKRHREQISYRGSFHRRTYIIKVDKKAP